MQVGQESADPEERQTCMQTWRQTEGPILTETQVTQAVAIITADELLLHLTQI